MAFLGRFDQTMRCSVYSVHFYATGSDFTNKIFISSAETIPSPLVWQPNPFEPTVTFFSRERYEFVIGEKFQNFTELYNEHETFRNVTSFTFCWTICRHCMACSTKHVPALAALSE